MMGESRPAAGLPARLEGVRAALAALFPNAESPRRGPPAAAGIVRYRAERGRLQPSGGAGLGSRRPGTAGRVVYAVGDVHGRFDLLVQLLREIRDDAAARGGGASPLLVFCGDYVDRGPQSPEVLEALAWLARRGPWQVTLLLGNHEQALLDFLAKPEAAAGWVAYGGLQTLQAYGVDVADPDDPDALALARDRLLAAMPASHLLLLQGLDHAATVGDYAFVHAGVAPGQPLERQDPADLLWIRDEFLQADRPCDRVVVHGHTWTDEEPRLLPHRIGLDTGAFRTGVLTAVRLEGEGRRILQARDAEAARRRSPAQGGDLVGRPADFTQGRWRVNVRLAAAPVP